MCHDGELDPEAWPTGPGVLAAPRLGPVKSDELCVSTLGLPMSEVWTPEVGSTGDAELDDVLYQIKTKGVRLLSLFASRRHAV